MSEDKYSLFDKLRATVILENFESINTSKEIYDAFFKNLYHTYRTMTLQILEMGDNNNRDELTQMFNNNIKQLIYDMQIYKIEDKEQEELNHRNVLRLLVMHKVVNIQSLEIEAKKYMDIIDKY